MFSLIEQFRVPTGRPYATFVVDCGYETGGMLIVSTTSWYSLLKDYLVSVAEKLRDLRLSH